MEKFIDLVLDTIKGVADGLSVRIDTLERRTVTHGINGKDGADGKDAPSVDLDEVAHRAAALLPRPADGLNGKDGQDGAAGVDAPPVDLDEVARRAAALLPLPTNGRDGADGLPGPVGDRGPQGDLGPPGVIEREIVDRLETRLGAVEATLAQIQEPPVESGLIVASLSDQLRKELPIFTVPPLRLQKRVIRDDAGKVSHIVDEVAP